MQCTAFSVPTGQSIRPSHLLCAVLFSLTVLPTCSRVVEPLYEPVVTFTGYYDKQWVELPGHAGKPNQCYLTADTVWVECYSDGFDDSDLGRTVGYRLILRIHPFTVDTTKTFWTGHIRARFTDFATLTRFEATRVLNPQDTAWGAIFTASGGVQTLQRRPNGRIEIDKIYIPLHNENQDGLASTIEQAELKGTIQR